MDELNRALEDLRRLRTIRKRLHAHKESIEAMLGERASDPEALVNSTEDLEEYPASLGEDDDPLKVAA